MRVLVAELRGGHSRISGEAMVRGVRREGEERVRCRNGGEGGRGEDVVVAGREEGRARQSWEGVFLGGGGRRLAGA